MNQFIIEQILESGKHLQLIRGDITEERVDAIVNAANAHLQHGGGVAGAISRNGGPEIQIESDAWIQKYGPISHQSPAYTSGGKLPCRYVIHVVGPVWGEGEEDQKMDLAIRGALRLGDKLGLASITFPAISTGIFGFPIERAARITLIAIQDYFQQNAGSGYQVVRVILYDQNSLHVFQEVWKSAFDIPSNS
jgi:O-acetyl-ADP-ribose deacetylase (regulator of RNase III)